MSMLSDHCDKLRIMAEQTEWEIPEAAALMRESANIIWKLRNSESDNAKLRELLAEARTELVDMYYYMDGGYAWPSIAEDPNYGPFYRKLCDVLGVKVDG